MIGGEFEVGRPITDHRHQGGRIEEMLRPVVLRAAKPVPAYLSSEGDCSNITGLSVTRAHSIHPVAPRCPRNKKAYHDTS